MDQHTCTTHYSYPVCKTVLLVTLISRIINVNLSQVLVHLEQQTQSVATSQLELITRLMTNWDLNSLVNYHDVLAVQRQVRYQRLHRVQKFHSASNVQRKTKCLTLVNDDSFKHPSRGEHVISSADNNSVLHYTQERQPPDWQWVLKTL